MSDGIESKEQATKITCRCPFCEVEMAEVLPFCASCGVALAECSNCGEPVARDVAKCPSCGAEIKQ